MDSRWNRSVQLYIILISDIFHKFDFDTRAVIHSFLSHDYNCYRWVCPSQWLFIASPPLPYSTSSHCEYRSNQVESEASFWVYLPCVCFNMCLFQHVCLHPLPVAEVWFAWHIVSKQSKSGSGKTTKSTNNLLILHKCCLLLARCNLLASNKMTAQHVSASNMLALFDGKRSTASV